MSFLKAVAWAVYYQIITVLLALLLQVIYFAFSGDSISLAYYIQLMVVSLFYAIISFVMAIVFSSYRQSKKSPFMWTLISTTLYGALFYYAQALADLMGLALTYLYPFGLVIQHQVFDYHFNQQLMLFGYILLAGFSMWLGQGLSTWVFQFRHRYLGRSLRKQ